MCNFFIKMYVFVFLWNSWQDIVSKVNARMTKEESNKVDGSDGLVKTQTLHANVAVGKWENRAMHRGYLRQIGDNEAEMGMFHCIWTIPIFFYFFLSFYWSPW